MQMKRFFLLLVFSFCLSGLRAQSKLKNRHLEWVGPSEDPQSNMSKGGYAVFCVEMPISIKNILMDYVPDQTWNLYVYPKAGLGCNFTIHSASPTVGVGVGGTYRFKKRLSVYTDMSYQVITSEFMGGVSGTGISGSNGFFSFNVGIQVDLGKSCGRFSQKN